MALFDEEETIRRLSAMQASTPQYLSMQGTGLSALGDIAGIETPGVDAFREKQLKALSGFQSKNTGRLMQSEKKWDWWKEKAALNSMNTIAPMLGFAIGSTMKALPNPIAKVLGSAVNWGTAAMTYNMNFADTLEEHESAAGRKLTPTEQGWAAAVSMGVTALDLVAPIKGANATSSVIAKTFGKGGVNASKDSLVKLVNKNRESLRKSLGKGAKFSGKMIGTEMATEAGQKALQIGTSQTPGRLGTSEGAQDMFEEAIIAGPTVGAITAPAAIGVARETNRDIDTGRRLAEGFNKQVMEGESPTSLEDAKDLIKIPELDTNIRRLATKGNELAEKVTGVNFKEAGKSAMKGIAFKPLSNLIDIRNKARTGAEFHAANNAYQRFAPTGTGTGETQVQQSFFSMKEVNTGTYLKPVINVLNKHANKKRGVGFIGQDIDPEISKYIIEVMRNKPITAKPTAKFIADFSAPQPITKANPQGLSDLEVLQTQRDIVFNDLTAAGLDIGYVENYLSNPIDAEAVKSNKERFIELLIASSEMANAQNPNVPIITREGTAKRKGAEQIADDLINGIEPDVLTAREEEALAKAGFKGQKRKGFEKSRSEAWQYLDELAEAEGLNFRETNIEKILTGYMQKAATRVASVKAFGEGGSKLREDLKTLRQVKKADGTPALSNAQRDKVYDVYDAAHNTYKRDGNKNWLATSKMATSIGAITHLGLATISSFTELAWIGERAGFLNMLKTIPKAFDYTMKGVHRGMSGKFVEPGEGAQAMATLGFNLDPRVNERLDQIFSTDHNAVLSVYFRTPLGGFLTQWTNFNRNWAAQAMMSNINSRANSILSGTLSDIERSRLVNELKENGVSNDEFQFISKAFTNEQGKVKVDITNEAILNTQMPNGKTVRDVLVPWLHKVVDDVVVHPKAINKPLWMSDPKFAIIAQLKTFPVVFGNTVVKRLLRKLNPKQCTPDYGAAIGVVGGIAMAYALVHIGEILKDAIKGQDFESPDFRETLDRAGLTGAVGLLGGAGRFQDGATTSLIGVGAGFVDRAWADFITPLYTEQDLEAFPNLGVWLAESLDASLGVAGKGFKPVQSLFNIEDD